jgi:alkanesulfonate monooxygenase SsuD/methylene tetrahydromethanopterin reductase-like flavin-dependent oxidoreductase (luciferase family)
MSTSGDRPELKVGLLLGARIPPNELRGIAARAEGLGYDSLWCAEDYFFSSGLTQCATALSATERVPVGTGLVSILVRHPAILAMEAATIGRIYPGRFRLGVGLGGPEFMRQIGRWPKSPLSAMSDTITAIRALLTGEEITMSNPVFSADRVRLRLDEDAGQHVPIYAGACAPKMLRLTGSMADGNIVPFLSSPQFLEWACEEISSERTSASAGHHPVVAYAFFSVDSDGQRARDRIRSIFAWTLGESIQIESLFEAYGITSELKLLAEQGAEAIEREMPPQWLDDLTVVGDPDECVAKLTRFYEAGADEVVLYPMPETLSTEVMEMAAREVLPRLR